MKKEPKYVIRRLCAAIVLLAIMVGIPAIAQNRANNEAALTPAPVTEPATEEIKQVSDTAVAETIEVSVDADEPTPVLYPLGGDAEAVVKFGMKCTRLDETYGTEMITLFLQEYPEYYEGLSSVRVYAYKDDPWYRDNGTAEGELVDDTGAIDVWVSPDISDEQYDAFVDDVFKFIRGNMWYIDVYHATDECFEEISGPEEIFFKQPCYYTSRCIVSKDRVATLTGET